MATSREIRAWRMIRETSSLSLTGAETKPYSLSMSWSPVSPQGHIQGGGGDGERDRFGAAMTIGNRTTDRKHKLNRRLSRNSVKRMPLNQCFAIGNGSQINILATQKNFIPVLTTRNAGIPQVNKSAYPHQTN